MGEWIEWSGGECPVKGHAGVYVTLRNGSEFLMDRPATCWWEHDGCELDILRYRVVDDEAEREPDTPAKTLRDEFAMAADISRIEFPTMKSLAEFVGVDVPDGDDFVACLNLAAAAGAKIRYMFADAMLAARKESE